MPPCAILLVFCSVTELQLSSAVSTEHRLEGPYSQHPASAARVTCHVYSGHVPALRDVIVNHCQRCFNWPHALSTEHSPYRHTPCTPQISTRTSGPVELETTDNRTKLKLQYLPTLSHIETRDPSEGWSQSQTAVPGNVTVQCVHRRHPCLVSTIQLQHLRHHCHG